jgi:ABC-type nitrate/sulfonate/bicarbonate transport system permease component
VLLLLWQAIVSLTGISPTSPRARWMWTFLVTAPKAEANRAQMFPLVGQTLLDAWIGFVVGMIVAIVLSIAFSLSKAIEAGVMPLVLLLRTIPLVSIAPVIILVTGRGTPASVAVIGTVVVLFPALANVLFG